MIDTETKQQDGYLYNGESNKPLPREVQERAGTAQKTGGQSRKSRKAGKPGTSDETELQNVVNLPVEVNAFKRKYLIRKFNIGQIAQAMTYLGPLQYVVQELAKKPGQVSGGEIVGVILAALSISGDSAIGLISVATTEPIEWIQAQDDELGALRLLTATVEKNARFFSPENMAEYKELAERWQRAIPALSGITSTPSSSTDTDH